MMYRPAVICWCPAYIFIYKVLFFIDQRYVLSIAERYMIRPRSTIIDHRFLDGHKSGARTLLRTPSCRWSMMLLNILENLELHEIDSKDIYVLRFIY